MSVLDRFPVIRDALGQAEPEQRDNYPLSFQELISYFAYNNNVYPFGLNQTLKGTSEPIEGGFGGFQAGGFKGNGVVFACMAMRMRVFRQARMCFRQVRATGPGNLFGTSALDVLENPFGGSSTTGDLLGRAMQDVDLAGNFFSVRSADRIRRLRPDWVDIILTAPEGDPDAEPTGILYYPGGRHSQREPVPYPIEVVAHWAPLPDPIATARGMSWLTPIIREIEADGAMTRHRLKFFDNGGTPNMVVKFPAEVLGEKFREAKKAVREQTDGIDNAYKTLFLAAGADATVVGSSLRQLDFKLVQGAGETRVAAAAGVPPIIVGLSEGLGAATYSNYAQAKRAFADTTMADAWSDFCGSMANITQIPARAQLWYDADIPFLREDAKDAAEIEQVRAQTIRQLIEAGFKADAVVDAVLAGDQRRLVGQHTGLFSVQLQAPGSVKMPAGEVPGETPVGEGTAPEKGTPVPAVTGGTP